MKEACPYTTGPYTILKRLTYPEVRVARQWVRQRQSQGGTRQWRLLYQLQVMFEHESAFVMPNGWFGMY